MQTEVHILQLFVRTRIDLSELKSHIIQVLKSVVDNRGLKSNRFLVNKQKTEKIAPPFYWPASFKARLNALPLILFIALLE